MKQAESFLGEDVQLRQHIVGKARGRVGDLFRGVAELLNNEGGALLDSPCVDLEADPLLRSVGLTKHVLGARGGSKECAEQVPGFALDLALLLLLGGELRCCRDGPHTRCHRFGDWRAAGCVQAPTVLSVARACSRWRRS